MGRKVGERLKIARMSRKFDGTGVVKVQCSEGTYAALKLAQIPWPAEAGFTIDGQQYLYLDSRSMGVDGQRYRVIWPELSNGPGSKPRSSSFSLSAGHINETLFVLAEFLRDQGVEFVAIANKHGNAFSDVRLHGGSLAYVTGGVPHSPACHVNFGEHHLPELSGTSGGLVHDAPFNS